MSRFFIDQSHYFITVPTVNHQKLFDNDNKKLIIKQRLFSATQKYQVKNLDFSIMSFHYHLIGGFDLGAIIPRFLHDINGGSANLLNKLERQPGRKIWDEYHIYYIDKEDVWYKIRGYVVGNSYKHGEVATLEELLNYPFCTYRNLVEEIGREAAENLVLSVIKMSDEDIKKELKKELNLKNS